MTAAPKSSPDGSSGRVYAKRRPGPNAGKANVLGEETGMCTPRAAGVGVQTRRERLAEITSGRACAQQGLAATCKDRPCEAMPKPGGGQQVWRMSRYERRRRGNALPGGIQCLPRGGNTDPRQSGSGHLAAPGGCSDSEPKKIAPYLEAGDELMSKPASDGVYVGQDLSHTATGKACQGKPRSEPERGNPAFRDRRGACRNVSTMGVGLRPVREIGGFATEP